MLRRGGAIAELLALSSASCLQGPAGANEAVSDAYLIMSVFATGVRPLAVLRATRPDLRAVVLCTLDATAHRAWVELGIDRYLACSTMADATVRTYLADADVAVIPPPVRPERFTAPSRAAARHSLGVAAEGPTALLGGAWTKGPREALAEGLALAGVEVLAITGHHAHLHRRLDAGAERLAPAERRLHAYAHRDDMASCFPAADVVVSAPGQACREAPAVGRPLVVLDSVPGHGRENLLLELTRPGNAPTCGHPPRRPPRP